MKELWKQKREIGSATVYLGDCLEVLPSLGRVSAIITDPPYEKEAHTPMCRTRAGIEAGLDTYLGFDAISDEERGTLAEVAAGKCDGWLLAFCQIEAVSSWRDAIERCGAKYKRAMVWVKPDSSPQFNGQGPAQGHETIVAAWCGTSHSRWNGGGKRGVFEYYATHGRYGGHPTEKPLPLMSELVQLFTDAGAVVLDPFMGSGTTGVACIKAGRKFIGIEKNETFFELACKRLEETRSQPDMFVSEPMEQAALFATAGASENSEKV